MPSYEYRDSHVKDKTVIFNMGIPISGKDGLYIATGPWPQWVTRCTVFLVHKTFDEINWKNDCTSHSILMGKAILVPHYRNIFHVMKCFLYYWIHFPSRQNCHHITDDIFSCFLRVWKVLYFDGNFTGGGGGQSRRERLFSIYWLRSY